MTISEEEITYGNWKVLGIQVPKLQQFLQRLMDKS